MEKKMIVVPAFSMRTQRLRVAAYCRVSTNSFEQESSILSQRKHYEDLILSNPEWILEGIYWETGVTGTSREHRPELQRLIEHCERKAVDLVLTKSISRFARNTADCLHMVRTLLSLGVGIVFEKEGIDTRKIDSEFLLTLFSSVAQEESRSISANEKWAVRKRFRSGTFRYSKAPFGYVLVDGSFLPDPDKADIVRWIFQEAILGNSSTAIARELEAQSIPTGTKHRDGTAGSWSSSMVLGILRNVSYTGDVLMQKTFSNESVRHRKNRGEQDQFYMDGHHEAIVDRETFGRANSAVAARDRGKSAVSRHNRYPLSGKLRCGSCGSKMKRITDKRNGRIRYYWGCTAHIRDLSACSMKRIPEDTVLKTYELMVQGLIRQQEQTVCPTAGFLHNNDSAKNGPDLENIRRRTSEIIKEQEKLLLCLYREQDDLSQYHRDMALLNEEKLILDQELRSLYEDKRSASRALELLKLMDSTEELLPIDESFEKIVEEAFVRTGESIRFRLRYGLEWAESVM